MNEINFKDILSTIQKFTANPAVSSVSFFAAGIVSIFFDNYYFIIATIFAVLAIWTKLIEPFVKTRQAEKKEKQLRIRKEEEQLVLIEQLEEEREKARELKQQELAIYVTNRLGNDMNKLASFYPDGAWKSKVKPKLRYNSQTNQVIREDSDFYKDLLERSFLVAVTENHKGEILLKMTPELKAKYIEVKAQKVYEELAIFFETNEYLDSRANITRCLALFLNETPEEFTENSKMPCQLFYVIQELCGMDILERAGDEYCLTIFGKKAVASIQYLRETFPDMSFERKLKLRKKAVEEATQRMSQQTIKTAPISSSPSKDK